MAKKKTEFRIKVSAAQMPGSCWGRYKRIAVMKVEEGAPEIKMISTRARGVVRIVETWEKLNGGLGVRDAFSRAMSEANAMLKTLQK